jgi:hypothetical protein
MKVAWTLPLNSSDAGDFAAVVKKSLAFHARLFQF